MQAIDWQRFGVTEVPVSQLVPPALDWAMAMAMADGCEVIIVLGGLYGKPDSRYALLRGIGRRSFSPSTDLEIFGRIAAKYGPGIDLQLTYAVPSATVNTGAKEALFTASSIPEAGCRAMVAALLGEVVQIPNLLLTRPPENARAFHSAHLAGAQHEERGTT